MALRLVKGRNDLQLYLDSRMWSDPAILAVADKVRPYVTTFEPGAHELGSVAEVCLADGRKLTHRQLAPHGLPECPVSDGELNAIFRGLVSGIADDEHAVRIVEAIDALHNLDDVATPAEMLAP